MLFEKAISIFKSHPILLYTILGLLFYFTSIHKLGSLSLQPWDEALFALRALYMYETGSYMHDFSLMLGDQFHRNTKLPFTTILQVISFKILGVNLLALRLPNIVIFALGLFTTYSFSKNYLSDKWLGIVFLLVMIANPAWINEHMLRTGDQDAAFAIYMFVALFSYFIYTTSKNKKFLWLFVLGVLASVLTKNILGFIPGVALVLYEVYKKTLLTTLKTPVIWMAIFTLFLSYLGVIMYLNFTYPGFIDRMWNYELGGRFTNEIDNVGPWWKFIHQITFKFQIPFFLFTFYAIYQALKNRISGIQKDFIVLLTLHSIVYLVVISISQTKCNWYDAPILPANAMLAAIGIRDIYIRIKKSAELKPIVKELLYIMLILCIGIPYVNTAIDVSHKKSPFPDAKHGPTMVRLAEKHPEYDDYSVAIDKWNFTQEWYIRKLNNDGFQLKHNATDQFQIKDIVLVCTWKARQRIEQKFKFRSLYKEANDCELVELLATK